VVIPHLRDVSDPPQLAKMLIVSPDFKCSNEILTIVSMLSGTRFLSHLAHHTLISLSTQRLATTK